MANYYGSAYLKAEAIYEGYGNVNRVSVSALFNSPSSLTMMEGVKDFLKRKGKRLEGCTCRRIDLYSDLSDENYRDVEKLPLPNGSTIGKRGLWMVYGIDDIWKFYKRGNSGDWRGIEISEENFRYHLNEMVEEISKAISILDFQRDLDYEKERKEKESGSLQTLVENT